MYAFVFTNDDLYQARQALKIQQSENQKATRAQFPIIFRAGFFFGWFVPCCCFITVYCWLPEIQEDIPYFEKLVKVYYILSIPFITLLFASINVSVYEKFSINYRFMFDLRRTYGQEFAFHKILEVSGLLALIWSVASVGGVLVIFDDASVFIPLILFSLYLVMFLYPFKRLHFRFRLWFVKVLFRIVTAPFYPVRFADFITADQLTSSPYFIVGLVYMFCLNIYDFGPVEKECTDNWWTVVLAMLPSYWRLMQCLRRYRDQYVHDKEKKLFPHMVNAGKYTSSLLVTFLSALSKYYSSDTAHIIWIISAVFSTIYSYSWDIKMDWGLLQPKTKTFLLRDELAYQRSSIYYFAMFSNLLLRISWVWVISIGEWDKALHQHSFAFSLGVLELYRRFQWNFFRMENEHLNNCGQFRAVKEIVLPFPSGDPATNPQSDDAESDEDKIKSDEGVTTPDHFTTEEVLPLEGEREDLEGEGGNKSRVGLHERKLTDDSILSNLFLNQTDVMLEEIADSRELGFGDKSRDKDEHESVMSQASRRSNLSGKSGKSYKSSVGP
eukprot:Lithocolla_globosa_v1_NODE_1513_length_2520_cov_11.413793.p1 type:complete len:554 gc:universal NODE_1513_length_2520_cov_11.413793:1903-242(-)